MKQQTNNHIRLIFNRTIMFQRHFHSILCASTGTSFDNNSIRQKQWNFPLSSYTISTSSRSILALKILSHIAKSVSSFPTKLALIWTAKYRVHEWVWQSLPLDLNRHKYLISEKKSILLTTCTYEWTSGKKATKARWSVKHMKIQINTMSIHVWYKRWQSKGINIQDFISPSIRPRKKNWIQSKDTHAWWIFVWIDLPCRSRKQRRSWTEMHS